MEESRRNKQMQKLLIEDLKGNFLAHKNAINLTDRDDEDSDRKAYEVAKELVPLADEYGMLKELYLDDSRTIYHHLTKEIRSYLVSNERESELVALENEVQDGLYKEAQRFAERSCKETALETFEILGDYQSAAKIAKELEVAHESKFRNYREKARDLEERTIEEERPKIKVIYNRDPNTFACKSIVRIERL